MIFLVTKSCYIVYHRGYLQIKKIELAKIELMREQQMKLETDEKKRLNDIAKSKRQETENPKLLNQQKKWKFIYDHYFKS